RGGGARGGGAGRRPAAGGGPHGRRGHRRDRADVRPAGQDLRGGRGSGARRRPGAGGHRPALAVPARPGHDRRVGAQDRAVRGRARGPGHRRPRCRDRRAGHGGVLLPAGGPGAAGRRVLDPVPAVPAGGPLPAGPGPGAGRRRPNLRVLRGRAMSEVKQFKLPDVGEGLAEADIVAWHVKPGDSVSVNQVIVEIETAKAVVELPSPYEGVVTGLLAEVGQTVDVGTPIIAVSVGGEAGDGGGAGPATTGVPAGSTPAGTSAAAGADQGAAPDQGAATGADASAGVGDDVRDEALADELVPAPRAEGAVEPGIEGSPAPKVEQQAVLVGYGVKLGTTKRRQRKEAGA